MIRKQAECVAWQRTCADYSKSSFHPTAEHRASGRDFFPRGRCANDLRGLRAYYAAFTVKSLRDARLLWRYPKLKVMSNQPESHRPLQGL